MVKKRLFIILGWIIGLGITIACISYSSADTSWNTAGSDIIRNRGGIVGSVVADVLWQGLGALAVLIPAFNALKGRNTGTSITATSAREVPVI